MDAYAVTLADIHAAAARIAGHVHHTPVATCATLDRLAGRRLFLKCENLQRVGAFKFRGATNAVRRLPAGLAGRGVVTHSSGNHAQALALAASRARIPAHLVMPSTAPPVKLRAVEGYGGRIILCEPTLAAREATAASVVAATGATLIPPYDHPDVIAGQGTAALELLGDVPDLDAVVAPIGGGGLIAGIALAVPPAVRVYAAEPAGADDAARSKAAGARLPQTGARTMADGLLTGVGELTWPVLRDRVEAVLTVSEAEIAAALRLVLERAKLVIEPSAAVAVAGVLSEGFRALPGLGRVGVVLSGGNVELERLPSLLSAR